MTTDSNDRKPIALPVKNQPVDRIRTVVSGLVEFAPGGGFVKALFDDHVPTGAEKARDAWEVSVTTRVNEHGSTLEQHSARLNPVETIQGNVASLAVALAKACPNGLAREMFERSEILALLPDIIASVSEEAAWELDALKLVSIQRFIGKNWMLRLAPSFYEQIDHQVMGWHTFNDAVTLAGIVLDTGETRAMFLQDITGWTLRRFNPALRRMLDAVDQKRISQEIQKDYVCRYFIILPEDRVKLKRFLQLQPM